MILNEIQLNATPFNLKSTGVAQYDNWLHNPDQAKQDGFSFDIRQMSPQQYLDACCYGFKCSFETLNKRNDANKVAQYVQDITKGDKFPMCTLQFSKGGHFTQEGIHRALAAQQLDIKQIPVMVIIEQ